MTNRSACSVLMALAVTGSLAGAQSPTPVSGGEAFDVASVKRFDSASGGRASDSISVMPGGRFTAPGATLRGLIAAAYGILDIQIVDSLRVLPGDRFEIAATTRADVTVEQARAMLRTLLADRFRLVARSERRELPVYVLSVARDDRRLGDQLRRSGSDCGAVKGPPGVPPPPPPPAPAPIVGRVLALNGSPLRCGGLRYSSTNGEHLSIREITMAGLADRLVSSLARPVIDRTGLEGSFDVDLTYSLEGRADIDASNAPNAPPLVTAIREQLGLRLDATRLPVEVVVIDSVAAPTEN